MNWLTSGKLNARTVQLTQFTVRCMIFILTVGLPIPSTVTSMVKMEKFSPRITLDIMNSQILHSAAASRPNPQLSIGLEVDKLAKMVISLTDLLINGKSRSKSHLFAILTVQYNLAAFISDLALFFFFLAFFSFCFFA